jgi:general secretion pathway protein K
MRTHERGFALVAVLLVLALLGIVGAEFAYSMRLEASAMRSWRDNLTAAHLAEAAVEQALRELSADFAVVALADDGRLTFYTANQLPIERLARTRVRLGPGEYSYVITDEMSRINVNPSPGTATSDRLLDKVLQCQGVDKIVRDQIVDSVLDWIDANDEHRVNGAESEDYYLKLPTPYRARNAPLDSIYELLQVKAVTRRIFEGADGRPGLVDVLTTRGSNTLNVNTVTPAVMCGLGLAEANISLVTQQRRVGPFFAPPTFLGVNFGVTSSVFRIEAEGLIDGKPRASVTAVVQKQSGPTAGITVVEWSGVR